MKRAVLYTRVATIAQDNRTSSLLTQQKQLKAFCKSKGIEIVKCYDEHYSGANFNRPAFQAFLEYAEKEHENIEYLLFVSWDRFSRNFTQTNQMIKKLILWGINPIAIQNIKRR